MKNKHVVGMTKMYGSNRHRGRAGGEGGRGGLQIISIALHISSKKKIQTCD